MLLELVGIVFGGGKSETRGNDTFDSRRNQQVLGLKVNIRTSGRWPSSRIELLVPRNRSPRNLL